MKTLTLPLPIVDVVRVSRLTLFLGLLFSLLASVYAQVGIGTKDPDGSAQLDITSLSKGLLIPRMTKADRDNIGSPATGLLVFQTDYTTGFYFYNGSGWVPISPAPESSVETIVPFASGGSISMVVNAVGQPKSVSAIGFGASKNHFGGLSGGVVNLNPITISENSSLGFSVPRSGAISASFRTVSSSSGFGDNAPTLRTVTAQLYLNNLADDTFTQIAEAKVMLTSGGGNFGTTVQKGVISGLNIPVNAGDRLLLGFYLTDIGGPTADLSAGEITGLATGGLSLR